MADQLPSWADGEAKARILEFIRSVTEPGESFVPAPERVAADVADRHPRPRLRDRLSL